MKAKRLALASAIIVIAALILWALWPRTATVDTLVVTQAPATRVLAVNGMIRPRLSVEVKPPVGGTLLALPFNVGDRVETGTLIARVDDAPQRAAISEGDAAIRAQEATLAQARRDLARFEAIGEFVTRQRREEARLAVERGTQELARLRAARKQAAEVQGRYEIRAPFSGVILERPVDIGQTVGIESIIYRLADLAAPEVMADVDEVYAAELRPGSKARITMPGRETPLDATIVHIEPRVDPATGAREVRLAISETLDAAPAGLTVSVNLIVDEREKAISVPRAAILQPEGNAMVRVVDDGGLVVNRSIRFIDWPAASVIVTEGIKAGERILTNPQSAEPGDRVKVRQ